MNIAVLMTCYNRAETTLKCLESLFRNGECNLDVWLVDDASPDKTGEKVKAKYPFINVILGTGSLYWARGMHLAWESAIKSGGRFDFFLWLNDDVMLKTDAISSLLSDYTQLTTNHQPLAPGHSTTPYPVIVGACSEDDAKSVCSYGATDAKDVKIVPNGSSPLHALGWFTGNVVLVPYMAYKAVGMISPEYRHARADYDYAERLKRRGVPIFASSQYVGVCPCDFNERIKGRRLGERIRWLVEPSYFNLHDLFLFKRRYYGLLRALISCVHLILIVIRGT